MTFLETEVIPLLLKHKDRAPDWVNTARETHRTLEALVNGIGFDKELIEQIEHIESSKRAEARKKYSKDIRDLFFRVTSKRQNVFDASGGSEVINIDNEVLRVNFTNSISNIKNNNSLFSFLEKDLFNLVDVDPNGVILTATKKDKPYLYHKSIQDIRYYQSDGQQIEYIIFEPKQINDSSIKEWTIIDDVNFWIIKESNGIFLIDYDKSLPHGFSKTPCLVLSNIQILGSELRKSTLYPIIELSKEYARDKSILTIYKFLNGFPIHWRYVSQCRVCNGSGKIQNKQGIYDGCGSCGGSGYLKKSDVTDMVTLPLPREGQPNIAPNIAGYIAPDLDTWERMKEDLRDNEDLINDTLWGTNTIKITEKGKETATGRYIDTQPIINELNKYSNLAEYMYNTIANQVLYYIDPIKTDDSDELVFYKSFGRRYIIESPDVLIENYEKSKEKGANNTILDKQLEEVLTAKYKNDPNSLSLILKKAKIEPYVHYTTKEVFDYFGQEESQKKYIFHEFWKDADKNKDEDVLKIEFQEYFNNYKLNKNDGSM